jgi:hypothetical protein
MAPSLQIANHCKTLTVPGSIIFQLVCVDPKYYMAISCTVIKLLFENMGKLLKESVEKKISQYNKNSQPGYSHCLTL